MKKIPTHYEGSFTEPGKAALECVEGPMNGLIDTLVRCEVAGGRLEAIWALRDGFQMLSAIELDKKDNANKQKLAELIAQLK